MGKTGHADLPLHYGRVPQWLADRMQALGGAITESILIEYGRTEFLKRISDPFWFQSFGAVLGMDWHSSGITTSVMGALKRAVTPRSREWGLFVCGGRGRHSRKTPTELLAVGERTGLDGQLLGRHSRLTAKVDSTAVQDGFNIYLHNFIVSADGDWAVVQQGMNDDSGMARRYHWNSMALQSFINDPHAEVMGDHQGLILNMVHHDAQPTQTGLLEIAAEHPERMMKEIRKVLLPMHHEVRAKDVNLKRLGATIALAHESDIKDFESLLLTKGLGPRTLQSMVLVSEVIHGTPSRFEDPARFSFAHEGKDGHPFPVPLKVYDETIDFLNKSVDKAKIGLTDKQKAFKKLHAMSKALEEIIVPDPSKFEQWIEKERKESHLYGGRTVFDDKKIRKSKDDPNQLELF
ncbi:DUF763 domain-containing protein [Portibacter marinus]|uniref:DUF763 domain-containing protein n=1 Tax=Portibacter marinus TaxID=2898660 RepID=UPI001F415E91|nr:DUF763 domain-containing protein [Portibacter marinus]